MFKQSYFSDVGSKRKSNQDSLALVKANTNYGEVLLATVCDGMGGHSMGELASKHCVTSLCGWFKKNLPILLYEKSDDFDESIKRELFDLVRQINLELVIYGRQTGTELGSTLTAMLFIRDKYYCVHVGDSRCYEIGYAIRQITEDQSLLAEEVRQGVITEAEAKADKRKNLLLESVGITTDVNPLFYCGDIKKGTLYLICSDGLWHQLQEKDMQRYLDSANIQDNRTLRMHLSYLTNMVMERGEKDNITSIGIIPE